MEHENEITSAFFSSSFFGLVWFLIVMNFKQALRLWFEDEQRFGHRLEQGMDLAAWSPAGDQYLSFAFLSSIAAGSSGRLGRLRHQSLYDVFHSMSCPWASLLFFLLFSGSTFWEKRGESTHRLLPWPFESRQGFGKWGLWLDTRDLFFQSM